MALESAAASEKQADAIIKAMTGNQCAPSRYELKRMVNAGSWERIGELFHFTPVFMGKAIDWRCVPERVYKILQLPAFKAIRVPREPRAQSMLPAKLSTSAGHRERLYCEQSGQCHYCGQHTVFGFWTIDHKTPRSRQGSNRQDNMVGCCNNCNRGKGPLTYEEFMATDVMGGALSLKSELRRVMALLNPQKHELTQ